MKKWLRNPLILRILKKYTEVFAFPIRLSVLENRLVAYLGDTKKLLDLGSSNGKLVSLLAKKQSFEVIGVDTHILPETFIEIKKYDGRKLPFPNNSFDTVLIVDVLHHDEDPAKILQEAKRVAKKQIIIKDHFWQNKIDFLWLKIADFTGNIPYGVACPYNYLTLEKWDQLFGSLSLTKVRSERFRFLPLDPCRHVIFALSVN
ncbi:class I SAM-dependent methyltransferase [Candidatus Woesebacteria bacterium]|nr:class I SAM-dependent methyltransferase [Candidatus Woesebacteria bacterium]